MPPIWHLGAMHRTPRFRRARQGALILTILAAVAGLSATAASAEAAPEASLRSVTSVAGGGDHTCALVSGGQVRCWGDNSEGQLGTGDFNDRNTPTAVRNPADNGPLTGVVQLSVGYQYSCGRLASRQVLCWGQNDDGELGTGNDPTDSDLPRFVKNASGTGRLVNVATIVGGSGDHTCAILTNRQARCWGLNGDGQLGNGNEDDHSLPVAVRAVSGPGNLTGILQMDLGVNHTCARVEGNRVRCWGDGESGQLGRNSVDDASRPVVVIGVGGGSASLNNVIQIALGDDHSCAIVASREARCWGENDEGQLGGSVAPPTDHRTPVSVSAVNGGDPLQGVRQLTAGVNHTCARVTGGEVRCWGADDEGQLGNGGGGPSAAPVKVLAVAGAAPLRNVLQVAAGDDHNCARVEGNELRCWGLNDDRQLGDGTAIAERQRPVKVVV